MHHPIHRSSSSEHPAPPNRPVVTALLILGFACPAASLAQEGAPQPTKDGHRLVDTMASLLPCESDFRNHWANAAPGRMHWIRAARQQAWPPSLDLSPVPPRAMHALRRGLSMLRDAPPGMPTADTLRQIRTQFLRAADAAPDVDAIQVATANIHLEPDSGEFAAGYHEWLRALPARVRIAHRVLGATSQVIPRPASRWLAESLVEWAPDNAAALHEAGHAYPGGDPRRADLLEASLRRLLALPDAAGTTRDEVARDAFLAAAQVSSVRAGAFLDAHASLVPILEVPSESETMPYLQMDGLTLMVVAGDTWERLALTYELLGQAERASRLRQALAAAGYRMEWPGPNDRVREADVLERMARCSRVAWNCTGVEREAVARLASRFGLEYLPPSSSGSEAGTADRLAQPLRVRMADRHSREWGLERLWEVCRRQPVFGDQTLSGRSPRDAQVGAHDRDRDGLSDEDEMRLFTRAESPDTDGDGIPDGDDPLPQWASAPATGARDAANALIRHALADADADEDEDEDATAPDHRAAVHEGDRSGRRFDDTRYLKTTADVAAGLDFPGIRWVVLTDSEYHALWGWWGPPKSLDVLYLVAATPDRTRFVGYWYDGRRSKALLANILATGTGWRVEPIGEDSLHAP